MVDQSEIGSEHKGTNMKYLDGESSIGSPNEKGKRTCADCGTTKTPLWRGGPAGPKSLCNACGIRSRKRRKVILGLNKGQKDKKKARKCNNKKLGDGLDKRLNDLGTDVMMQRSKMAEKQQSKLGVEEQAALQLMALSYGFFYA